MKIPSLMTGLCGLVVPVAMFAQAELDYLRSLHAQEADVETYIERSYTDINVVPVSESTFNSARSTTVGDSFVDPNFGREWTLIADASGGKSGVMNSERNGWNSDESLFALMNFGNQSNYKIWLFDGETGEPEDYIVFNLPEPQSEMTELLWMPNDPDKLFYFFEDQMFTFDITTEQTAVYETFASFSFTTGRGVAGGDGNDVAPNGDILIGNKGSNCFVYNIPLKKVVRLSGGSRVYLDPGQSFTTFSLGDLDYACAFAEHIIELDEDGGGTVLRDINGNYIQELYRRTPHMDPTYFLSGGVLYPGIMVRYNQADANYYNGEGLSSTVGTAYFHGWDPSDPSEFVRFEMDPWSSQVAGSGGQHSANRFDGSTGIVSVHGPEETPANYPPWESRFGEVYEQAYHAGEATLPRRFAHHYIGYDSGYGSTSNQPESWLSPDGDFAFIKTQWGWYRVDLGPRMTIAQVDNYLNGGGNTAPTITAIANQTVNEDTATSALAFTIGDAETAAGSLTLSGASSNTSLVPVANIVFGGSGASRTVTVTPAADASGTATITVTVSDGALTDDEDFVLTVNAVNDAPVISSISNQTINEDASTGAIGFTVSDAETAAGSLTVTGSSSNTSVVPNGNIILGGSGGSRTVTVNPASNANGSATITLTVDDGSATDDEAFLVTVNPVNDAPEISDIANQSIGQGSSTGALAFTVTDLETAAGSLGVSGSSSNTTLVPNGNITFGGSGANRTVTVTPAAGQTGTATITVTVSDGVDTDVDTFDVTVTAMSLPFYDDFEDEDAADWNVVAGTWSVADNDTWVYRQSATSGDGFTTVGSGWTDQVVQARVRAISFNGSNRHVSVYGRFTDTNNHYYMALRSNNTIELKKKVGGTVTTLQVVSFTMSTNTWFDVRLDVIGTSLVGYMDGVQKVSATDSALTSGAAGLGLYNAVAEFDDIAVTATPPPDVLLAEDFEDDTADDFTTSGGSWSIATDGSKTWEQSSTAASDAVAYYDTSWTDQVVEVDAKPLAFNGSNRGVFVYARWTDSDNHYYIALRSSNTLELKKKVGGTVTTLQSTSHSVSTGTWYKLKLAVVGTTLTAYVDDQALLTATDSDLSSGTVAVGMYAASARFDDLVVTDDL